MHEFRPRDFVGGHPVIDFVNTVTARDARPVDRLEDYAALRRWAAMSALGVAAAPAAGPAATDELRRCTELRESVHAALTAVIDVAAVPSAAAAAIQANWRHAADQARLDLTTYPFVLRFAETGDALTRLRRCLAAAAVDLLTRLPRERLRRCPGERCGWLFLDSSKAGRRRWCDMGTCGTHDKNRRRPTTQQRDGG